MNPFSAAGEGHPLPHMGLKFKKVGTCLRANEPHAQAEQKKYTSNLEQGKMFQNKEVWLVQAVGLFLSL